MPRPKTLARTSTTGIFPEAMEILWRVRQMHRTVREVDANFKGSHRDVGFHPPCDCVAGLKRRNSDLPPRRCKDCEPALRDTQSLPKAKREAPTPMTGPNYSQPATMTQYRTQVIGKHRAAQLTKNAIIRPTLKPKNIWTVR